MTRRIDPYQPALESEAIATYRQGEVAERTRIMSIVESDEARNREGTATFLALHTDLPARVAVEVLSLTPRAAWPAHRVRPLRWPTVQTTFSIVGTPHVNT